MVSWEDAENFMDRIHLDIAFYKDKKLLVLVDSSTKWVDVQTILDLTTQAVIKVIQKTIKYVGIPKFIVTDNGTNFVSRDFDTFLKNNFIWHIRTPPGHHSSNGQAERVI